MKRLPIDPALVTYVDLGCGKGRTLLLASEMGFRRIIGVDISPQLCRVAQQNLTRRKVRAELACCDVREFDFPSGASRAFMYNPFYPEVMLRIAENLKISVRSHPREVYVVYYSAPIRGVWKDLDFGVFRETDYTYPNYAIFHTNAPEPVDVRAGLSSIR